MLKCKIIRLNPAEQSGIYVMIFILIFVGKWLKYHAIYNLSVWLRTSFNPVEIKRFRSRTGLYNFLLEHTTPQYRTDRLTCILISNQSDVISIHKFS